MIRQTRWHAAAGKMRTTATAFVWVIGLAAGSTSGCARLGAVYSSPALVRPVGAAGPAIASGPVRVRSVVDLRQDYGRRGHAPQLSSNYGFFTPVFVFGGGRTDGPNVAGDARTNVAPAPWREAGNLLPALDLWLADVVTHASGRPAQPAPAVPIEAASVEALAGGDGVTVVPLLDQFDTTQMSSEDSISGGGSSRSGNQVITTSGASSGVAKTRTYLNVRLRLAMFEVAGGVVRRQQVAWLAHTEYPKVIGGSNQHEPLLGALADRASKAVREFAAAR